MSDETQFKLNRRHLLSATALGALSFSPLSANASNSNGKFSNKVVIVTGGTSGIGKMAVIMFAKEGAKVFFNGRRKDKGEEVEKLIKSSGGEASFYQCDVSDHKQVKAFFKAAIDKYDRIDIAFNNAGISQNRVPLHETSLEDWSKIHSINLTGVFLCMKYEISQMLQQKNKGAIINMSSISGHTGSSRLPGYTSSKHAVAGLTRDAGHSYAEQGIRINAVSPSDTRTPMQGTNEDLIQKTANAHPMKRIARPEEIVKAVMFLASDDASYIQGETLQINGSLLTV